MSGSWDQSGRKLIDEIKETLRLHFKGVAVHSSDLSFSTDETAYTCDIPAETYGGVLFPQTLATAPLEFEMTAGVQRLHSEIDCAVAGDTILMDPPLLQEIPVIKMEALANHHEDLIPESPEIQEILVDDYKDTPAQYIPASALTFVREKSAQKIHWDKLDKPVIQRIKPRLKEDVTISRLAVHTNPLPIFRKPIPPHRFSKENRELFRSLLAQKAKLPVSDMQIVGVFDRMFLNLYQSLSQGEEGSLLCYPKGPLELRNESKESLSAYLIIGKSARIPDKTFQVIVPMKDTYK